MTYRIIQIGLSLMNEQVIHVAHTAQVLSVIKQDREIFLCVLEDDDERPVLPLSIIIIKTNENFNDFQGYTFVGTLTFDDADDSYHVFYMWRKM